jgi:hypothetical protein
MHPRGGIAVVLLAFAAVAGAAQRDAEEARVEARIQADHDALARASRAAPAQAPATAPAQAAGARSAPDGEGASAPVLASAVPPPPSPNDDWLAHPPAPDTLAFDELGRHLGEALTVFTRGEREHRGTLAAANARTLTLVVRRRGGKASYTLRREQVLRIEPR